MEVVITGVERYGVFAQGTELPAEGLISIDTLEDDFYELDDTTLALCGRRTGNTFRLGDRLLVTIDNVDLDRRELDFRYVRHLSSAASELPRRRRMKKTQSGKSKSKKKNKPSKKPKRNKRRRK